MKARVCQSKAGFTPTCPPSEINDDPPATLGHAYGQHVTSPQSFLAYMSNPDSSIGISKNLTLQISIGSYIYTELKITLHLVYSR
jgi:hypothetical protein